MISSRRRHGQLLPDLAIGRKDHERQRLCAQRPRGECGQQDCCSFATLEGGPAAPAGMRGGPPMWRSARALSLRASYVHIRASPRLPTPSRVPAFCAPRRPLASSALRSSWTQPRRRGCRRRRRLRPGSCSATTCKDCSDSRAVSARRFLHERALRDNNWGCPGKL
jgi:hypothetical protein